MPEIRSATHVDALVKSLFILIPLGAGCYRRNITDNERVLRFFYSFMLLYNDQTKINCFSSNQSMDRVSLQELHRSTHLTTFILKQLQILKKRKKISLQCHIPLHRTILCI